MLVDMHFHSSYSYDCSTSVDAIIRKCRQLGVSVALTDHNAIGGVLAAERIAPGVIKPAVEICTAEGKDVIPYFQTVEELSHFFDRAVAPRLRRRTSLQSNATRLHIAELFDELKHEDCIIGLPHPFAMPPRRSYMYFMRPKHRTLLQHIDAVEGINETLLHRQNLAAVGWAVQHDKPLIAGSDGHQLKALGSAFTYGKAADWGEFLAAIRARQTRIIGEERTLRHQVGNAAMLMREKARVFKNLKMEFWD
jgi:predicted metal-dependent phosphoesterase TrpH